MLLIPKWTVFLFPLICGSTGFQNTDKDLSHLVTTCFKKNGCCSMVRVSPGGSSTVDICPDPQQYFDDGDLRCIRLPLLCTAYICSCQEYPIVQHVPKYGQASALLLPSGLKSQFIQGKIVTRISTNEKKINKVSHVRKSLIIWYTYKKPMQAWAIEEAYNGHLEELPRNSAESQFFFCMFLMYLKVVALIILVNLYVLIFTRGG